jgi:Uma2 family endonuclease
LDVLLSDGDVYQPDIIFISSDRLEIIGKKKIEGSPDIVIEILSSGTAYFDLRIKYRAYEEYGVREYWIVDPELKKIEVYENQNEKFKIYSEAEEKGNVSSKVLDKLSISLDEIFNLGASPQLE